MILKHSSLLNCLSVLFALTIVSSATTSLAAHHEGRETTASDVKEEVVETYEAIKDYTLEQREELIAAVDKRIESIDSKISDMQGSIDEKWQHMSKSTQVKTRQTLDALRQKREDLSEWIGGLRYSSEEAWEEVKIGFSESYDRLEMAFKEAKKDFNKEE